MGQPYFCNGKATSVHFPETAMNSIGGRFIQRIGYPYIEITTQKNETPKRKQVKQVRNTNIHSLTGTHPLTQKHTHKHLTRFLT